MVSSSVVEVVDDDSVDEGVSDVVDICDVETSEAVLWAQSPMHKIRCDLNRH